MKKVLALCIGNACRSQMAEGYLKFYGKGSGCFFSAGLYPNELHPLAVQVMAEDNIDISNQFSKSIQTLRSDHFDYALFLCNEISNQTPDFLRGTRVVKMYVPDPTMAVGAPEVVLEEFRRVREMIKTKILKFIGQELILQPESVEA